MSPRLTLAMGAAVTLAACQTLTGPTENEVKAVMSGAQEVPGPGDADGSGSFEATIKPGGSQVCYNLEVGGIEPATAAHIHRGGPGEAGPAVVTLQPPTHGESGACAEAEAELAREIAAAPERFYVNVHNAPFPAGAVRGQLGR